jgi:membrane protease YdiL (CAAX protease family)
VQLDERDTNEGASSPEPRSKRSASSARAGARLSLGQASAAVFVAFVLAQLLGRLAVDIASSVYARPGAPLIAPSNQPAEVIVASMVGSELALLIVALLVPLLAALPVRETLGLHMAKPQHFVAASVGTFMLGPLGDTLMSTFARLFPGFTLGAVPALNELARSLPIFVVWPVFALLPGVAEELVFRGVLQGSLGRTRLAVIVSGVAFAVFHVDPVHVVGVLPLGLFMAWVAYRTSTLVTLVAHVVNNSVAVITIRLADLDVGYDGTSELPLSWVVVSLVVVFVAARTIERTSPPAVR